LLSGKPMQPRSPRKVSAHNGTVEIQVPENVLGLGLSLLS
jgi:hypothetical protein